jgi:hypothetical protein
MAWEAVSDSDRDGLNTALNEATWSRFSVDPAARRVRLLLDVLSLPADGPARPEDPVFLDLDQVSRIAASLREGWWNDSAARVVPLTLEDLSATVRSFGGCPIYGFDFLDSAAGSWPQWRDRLSVDAHLSQQEAPHVIDIFQEGSTETRHLDLRIWFTLVRISTPDERDIPLTDFISAGVRWWDGFRAGDPRTAGKGMVSFSAGSTAPGP